MRLNLDNINQVSLFVQGGTLELNFNLIAMGMWLFLRFRGLADEVMVGDEVVGRKMVWLSLTFDHRLVDGGPAARFLQRIVQLVERTHLLMA